MRHEDTARVSEALNQVREMLTIGADDLCTVFEQAVCVHPEVSTHGEAEAAERKGTEGGGGPRRCIPSHTHPSFFSPLFLCAWPVFLAFERAVALRENLSKDQKKAALAEALEILRRSGQPPEESDDLMSAGEGRGWACQPTHVSDSDSCRHEVA
jgi:hypothetical protein